MGLPQVLRLGAAGREIFQVPVQELGVKERVHGD